MQKHFTLLALGDSYTIGEGVLLQESFPYQTVQELRKEGYDFAAPEVIARTGWTTEELQTGMAGYTFLPKYDFVSLLIGVNNQYRLQEFILYKQQFESLLNKSVALAGGKNEHVVVLSIPDYSITPFAKEKDVEKISKEIEEYNKLTMAICIQYKIAYLDLSETLQDTGTDSSLLAEDGLHPSANVYNAWAKKLAAGMMKVLKK